MLIKKQNTYKIILLIITAITVIMGILIFISPTSIYPDPSWGFQVMRSMQLGGGFNLIIGPNPVDLSKNLATFLSWWSPGQYLVPYFFKSILSINAAHAAALTIVIGSLLGLAGFYCFFKKIGFSQLVSALSLVFIVCQQAYWVPYAFYNGGEILLFAFEGWFLYGCVTLTKPGLKLLAFVLLSGWIGFVCKSSFMWIYAAGLLCLWIRLSIGQVKLLDWIKKGFWIAIPAVISLATIYVCYLSKGENPASASGGFKLSLEAFAFPLGSPLLAGFSVDDLADGLIFHNEPSPFTPGEITAILLTLAILSLALIILIIRYIPNKNYRLFIIVFYSVSLLFFGNSFLHQAAISYEGRHFRLIGLLIVPGVIYLIGRSKLPLQLAFIVICGFIAFKSFEFTRITRKGDKAGAHGVTGLSQQFIDQPSLNYIMALDKQNIKALFVFISADIGLEIQHHRMITIEPYDAEIADDDRIPYLGHAQPIYMVLPMDYTGKKAAVMFKYFPGYKNFTATRLSKNYVLYTAQ